MRHVGLGDLDVAARALCRRPRSEWEGFARDLLEGAHAADIWRKRYGRAHPAGGTGSLYAQASLHPRVTSSACDAQYCAAMGVVLRALEVWRARSYRNL